MKIKNPKIDIIFQPWQGFALATVIGLAIYYTDKLSNIKLPELLVISLLCGIFVRTFILKDRYHIKGLEPAIKTFFPAGVIFYAFQNANFANITKVKPSVIFIISIVMLVNFITILVLGKLLRQKRKITSLLATGSAICGASAIAISSTSYDADSDDISISIIAITLAGCFALFIFFPFVGAFLNIPNITYGQLCGTTLQFTSFVKSSVDKIPYLEAEKLSNEVASFAYTIKSVRYFGLLIAIPIFASLIKKRVNFPFVFWVFLTGAIAGTLVYSYYNNIYTNVLGQFTKPVYLIIWSAAMAAVGLHVDAKKIFAENGLKAIVVAFTATFAATISFFVGLMIVEIT